MRTFPTSTILALFLVAPAVHAHDHARERAPWYLQLGLGGVQASDADAPGGGVVGFDPGFGASLALGASLFGGQYVGMAAEIEGLFTSFNTSEEDLGPLGTSARGSGALGFMGNLIVDLHLSESVAWYVGGGAGFASKIEYETFDTGAFNQTDTDGFCYQGKAGITYHLGGLSDVSLGYRFFATEDVAVVGPGGTSELGFENHMIEVSYRWGL